MKGICNFFIYFSVLIIIWLIYYTSSLYINMLMIIIMRKNFHAACFSL